MPEWVWAALASLVVAGIAGWVASTLNSQRKLAAVSVLLEERQGAERRLADLFREDLQDLAARVNTIEREASSTREVAMNLDGRVSEFAATIVTKTALEDRTQVLVAQMETVRVGLQGDIQALAARLGMVLEALTRIEESLRDGH